jgi:hypothetical protein
MYRRIAILITLPLALLSAAPASAQIPVTDAANLVQAILIATRTQAHYETLRAQYQTILRMAEGLGSMEGYRIPTITTTRHDPGRWEYGSSWLQALNSGDPAGSAYRRSVRELARPGGVLSGLPDDARRAIESAYATVEIGDSVGSMATHQVGALRGYSARLQQSVDAMQDDVLNGLERYHEVTAIMDKIAGGELLGRRQDTVANQLLSHLLEQLLIRGKRLRDAEVAAMNMRLGDLRDGRATNTAFIAGTADALRTWRQP